jgi:hypothetical protein
VSFARHNCPGRRWWGRARTRISAKRLPANISVASSPRHQLFGDSLTGRVGHLPALLGVVGLAVEDATNLLCQPHEPLTAVSSTRHRLNQILKLTVWSQNLSGAARKQRGFRLVYICPQRVVPCSPYGSEVIFAAFSESKDCRANSWTLTPCFVHTIHGVVHHGR